MTTKYFSVLVAATLIAGCDPGAGTVSVCTAYLGCLDGLVAAGAGAPYDTMLAQARTQYQSSACDLSPAARSACDASCTAGLSAAYQRFPQAPICAPPATMLTSPTNDTPSSCTIAKSQTLSQPCCLGHGVDACGANLFCAAFDGRTQATCYVERSRADQTECTADIQCTSGACNTTAKRCRSMPSTSCSASVGCAPDPTGKKYGCDPENDTCKLIGNGKGASFCVEDTDCDSNQCDQNLCGALLGGACSTQTDTCLNGSVCKPCGSNSADSCDPSVTATSQCLLPCPSHAPWDFGYQCNGPSNVYIDCDWDNNSGANPMVNWYGTSVSQVDFERDAGSGFQFWKTVLNNGGPSTSGIGAIDLATTPGQIYAYRAKAHTTSGIVSTGVCKIVAQ